MRCKNFYRLDLRQGHFLGDLHKEINVWVGGFDSKIRMTLHSISVKSRSRHKYPSTDHNTIHSFLPMPPPM
jgi:hypothetical protein